MTKLIVVLGGTGTQGSSVIDAFVNDPEWKVRTVNRDPAKQECKLLEHKGVQVVKGSFDDVDSLIAAFEGANVVFGVTDFWAAFVNLDTPAKLGPGQSINEYCYDVEVQHGKNIADAVATIADSTLETYVWSSLSHAAKWSRGKYTWVYHFDSKAAVYEYILATHAGLAKKTSTVQIGWYADNWKKIAQVAPRKAPDGVYEWVRCGSAGHAPIPWVDTQRDTGKFVRALVGTSPGKHLLGVSQMVTADKYMELWGRLNGVPARVRSISADEFDQLWPSLQLARELRESSCYSDEFGWDGGEPGVLRPSDLAFEQPLTMIEEYFKAQDWSSILH
ncbi:NmrA-like family domain-containing protein 1 [Lipomyces orientalis]|uniref:NmrA-like family domain-containing protein 1 n=1 Tax=Lipomyces orientalis TaxID=1233043 RepID=A0ACC3TFZ6_9ASCO